jgi:predicted cupin superfamily sugar epimerase
MSLSAEAIIARLGLEPLPNEGGHYKVTWRSRQMLARETLPEGYRADHPVGSAIYFLLTDAADGFSALHRLPTDEIYHFYLGDPAGLLLLHPDGSSEHVIVGPDLLAGQRVQAVAPGGSWQGSRLLPGGRLALLGTTMAPGFDWSDFELGSAAALTQGWPPRADEIRALTR